MSISWSVSDTSGIDVTVNRRNPTRKVSYIRGDNSKYKVSPFVAVTFDNFREGNTILDTVSFYIEVDDLPSLIEELQQAADQAAQHAAEKAEEVNQ